MNNTLDFKQMKPKNGKFFTGTEKAEYIRSYMAATLNLLRSTATTLVFMRSSPASAELMTWKFNNRNFYVTMLDDKGKEYGPQLDYYHIKKMDIDTGTRLIVFNDWLAIKY